MEKYWKEKGQKVFHLEIGDEFRDLLSMTTYTASLAREVSARGEIQPEFLAIGMWASLFNKYYSPEKNVIIDGSPRKEREALVLDGALKFYSIKNPIVIYLEVSPEVAKERMLSRHRQDDEEEKIEGRLRWFERETMKSIKYFQNNPDYLFYKINGEQSVEEIHREIMEKITL